MINNRLDSLLQVVDVINKEIETKNKTFTENMKDLDDHIKLKESFDIASYLNILDKEAANYYSRISELYLYMKLTETDINPELLKRLESINNIAVPAVLAFEGNLVTENGNLYELISSRTPPAELLNQFKEYCKAQAQPLPEPVVENKNK